MIVKNNVPTFSDSRNQVNLVYDDNNNLYIMKVLCIRYYV